VKISIINAQALFIRGGAEYLADSLAARAGARGHQVEMVRIPFQWNPPQAVADHMLACRMLRLDTGEPDLVIALKFPAYLAACANKKVWLLHQFRQAYDLWGSAQSSIADSPEGHGLRDLVVRADNVHLRQAKELFTISRNVAGRLKRFNGIDADAVLYPPVDRPELFRAGEFEDYFFYPSRMNSAKRQLVAVEAMRHVRSPFRLVLAGKADTEEFGREVQQRIDAWNLQDRVTLLGWLAEEEKAHWMANACAAVFLPYDEDYGYVTVEAFHCHKPVITFTDSGGTNELVTNGVNGLIVGPSPEHLADAMESLWIDRPQARAMGQAGFETLAQRHIEWDYVLDRLLAAA
jgi:glycosyltransferase involved in cell wall biosynthesis